MVNKKSVGLPVGYDLRVSPKELLDEPVSLAGYLDDRPTIIRQPLEVQNQNAEVRLPEVSPQSEAYVNSAQIKLDENKGLSSFQVVEGITPTKVKPKRERALRLQINITPDVERKAQELVDIVSRQSPDGRVTISELMQALILNLYDARGDINGRLPRRGRWGTASAKSHSAELATVLREAILKSSSQKGTNLFKSAIGG